MKILILLILSSSIFAEVVDLKSYQTPVKSQEDRNTCAYFAITALLESAINVKFNKELDLSEQFQIFYGKEHFNENTNKEFGNLYEIALNYRNQGFIFLEDQIPYQNSFFESERPCSEEDSFNESTPSFCFSQAPLKYDINDSHRLGGLEVSILDGMFSFWKTRVELIQDELKKNNAVAITLKVYPPLWDNHLVTYPKEIDEKCENGELNCYGHAVLITGFDSIRNVFFFKNSWGEDWGNKGYGELSNDYINNYSDMPTTISFNRILAILRLN